MEFFEISESWVIALGKTLVHSLWIGLLMLSLLKVILQFIPGMHSGTRYRITVATMFLYVGSITWLFISLYAPSEPVLGGLSVPLKEAGPLNPFYILAAENVKSPIRYLCYISSYIYFAGLFIMIIRSGLSFRSMYVIRNCSIPVKDHWIELFNRIKEQIGIGQRVDLLCSDLVDAPLLTGLIKPAVIVPVGMFTHLSTDQVETILMHELYHLRRLDFLMNLIQLIVEALFFYNPAVWSISRMIRAEREKCCDDRVLKVAGSPVDYANALYQLASQRRNISLLAPSAGGSDHHQLFNRIKRILNQTTMKSNIREKLYALMLLAGGVGILLTLSGFSQGFSIIQHDYFKQEAKADSMDPVQTHLQDPVVQAVSMPIAEPIPAVVAVPVAIPVIAPLPLPVPMPDTLPKSGIDEPELDEKEAARLKALEEIDWEQMKKDIEAAKKEAMEGIDWEQIKKDMEAAKKEALEEIDWEEIKKDIETAKQEAMEEIDWDEIKKEMEKSRVHLDSIMQDFDFDFDFDFDMDEMRLEIEGAMKEMEEIDWEKMEMELERSLAEIDNIDVDEIRKEVEKELEENEKNNSEQQ